MQVRVENYVGHHGMQMPLRLQFDGHHVNVVEVLDQWHGPGYRYVKLKSDNECLYILRHDALRDEWELTMFEEIRARHD